MQRLTGGAKRRVLKRRWGKRKKAKDKEERKVKLVSQGTNMYSKY
jgi:hypothetical protein